MIVYYILYWMMHKSKQLNLTLFATEFISMHKIAFFVNDTVKYEKNGVCKIFECVYSLMLHLFTKYSKTAILWNIITI